MGTRSTSFDVTCGPPLHIESLVLLLLSVLFAGHADGQELEPRHFADLPVGLNFLAVGYGLSEGGILFDPALELDNAKIDIDGPTLGFARSLGLAGLSSKVDANVSRVCLSGSADYEGERVTRDVCGLTDAQVRLSVNFVGAPALSMTEFAEYRQNLIVGASLQVSTPTGQYDPSRLINIGTNRWSARAEIGMSKTEGPWFLELALSARYYQANDDFFGGLVRKEDPIYQLQGHLVRNLRSGHWFALDVNYYRGGETTTGGIANPNLQSNARFGATLSIPFGAKQSLKILLSRGVLTRTGTDVSTLGAIWQYRWGP
jgi:hypothetical protein